MRCFSLGSCSSFWPCTSLSRARIRGRAVKALRSGRSQLCWRGFESHRMQRFFLLFFCFCFWTGSSFASSTHQGPRKPADKEVGQRIAPQKPNKKQQKKNQVGGTGIRARVKRITTAYANHYTIPPKGWLPSADKTF